jgi:hypothetical protein
MKRTFLILLILPLFFLSACQKETESSHPAESAPTIDKTNVKPFLKKLAKEYVLLANDLSTNSKAYFENDDLEHFLIYRNGDWTPNYVSRKLFYEKAFQHNKAYIQQHKLEKPFEIFSSLIYISLDIKHGFQNKDAVTLNNSLKRLEKEQRYMEKIKAL